MDAGAIINGTLSMLIGTLFLVSFGNLWKRVRARIQAFKLQQGMLDETLLKSKEYQGILDRRKSYQQLGYLFFAFWLVYIAAIIIILALTGKLALWHVEYILTLLGLTYMAGAGFYLGYVPISSQEVERMRQEHRARTLREALGARSNGYIIQEFIFPILVWSILVFLVISLVYIIAFPPSIVPIPLLVKIVVIVLATLAILHSTSSTVKWVYSAIKNLPNVPRQRRDELRQEYRKHEFDQ